MPAADSTAAPPLDFTARPAVVAAVAEETRLSYGHLFNPAFATEVSLIDPLPHQRIAVCERMLGLSPLRFLLADDAGAGKTIMTGLYLREVRARRLIRRVLVVPPAGLIGNWERDLRTLFSLPFRIVRGADARDGNPFAGPESDRVIVSVDTLVGERTFGRLREAAAPYDLVVFDEAHKLAAHERPDLSADKTDRSPRRTKMRPAPRFMTFRDPSWPGAPAWGTGRASICSRSPQPVTAAPLRSRAGPAAATSSCPKTNGPRRATCGTAIGSMPSTTAPRPGRGWCGSVFSAYAIPAASVQAAAEGAEGTKP